jgi:hypothetical protein
MGIKALFHKATSTYSFPQAWRNTGSALSSQDFRAFTLL